jgi:hypothetical protein
MAAGAAAGLVLWCPLALIQQQGTQLNAVQRSQLHAGSNKEASL